MKKYFFLSLMLVVSIMVANAKVGYLLTESTVENLPSEDGEKPEQNAANWFTATYGANGVFVSLADLKAGLDPATVKVLWINIDRMGLENLAAAGINDEALAKIKAYVEAGGQLLLTKQAAHIVPAIGRIGYAPGWNNVGYHNGADTWYIKTKLGGATANPTDRSTHAIYKDIAKDENGMFPLVGAVKRSDRNNNWGDYFRKDPNTGGTLDGSDPSTHYDNGNVLRLQDFENDWKCQALATWPHIQDYCLPMVIDFLPEYGAFKGGMLAICLAAYQWGTGNYDTTNGYIANVQKMTQNSIEYLYGSDPTKDPSTAIDNTVMGEKAVKTFENGQLVIIKNGVKYNVMGAELR